MTVVTVPPVPCDAADVVVKEAISRRLTCRLGRPLAGADWNREMTALGLEGPQVLDLLVDLEDELGVRLGNDDLRPHRLESLSALAELLAERREERPTTAPRYVHVTSEFLPHVSGPARNVADLCRQLADRFDFAVYSFDLDRGLPSRGREEGIEVHRFAVPRFTDLLRTRRRWQRLAGHPGIDAETDCSFEMTSSEVLRELARSDAEAVVSWFYAGVLGQDLIELFPSKRWLLLPSFFEAPGSRESGRAWWDPARVHGMLFFQERELRLAVAAGIPKAQVRWAPLPIDTDRFRPLGGERDRDTLLYVGRLTPNKGLVAFLETFRWMVERRPSLRFRVIADLASPAPIEQREAARLRETVRRLGLTDRVELAGRREGEELVREMSSHAFHVLPSIGDFYSTVTAEALACGMTCVNLDRPHYEWQRRRDGDAPLVHLCADLRSLGETLLDLVERAELPDHRDYLVRHMSWQALRDTYADFLLA